MLNKNFFSKYFLNFVNLTESINHNSLLNCVRIFKIYKKNNKKIIFIGNGGSAAIASHISVDLSKNAKIRSINFNEADLITCLSNDYGHENWMKVALNIYCDKGDLVILISSSGRSLNILNAAKWCIKNKIKFITFSGNDSCNPLKKINSQGINFWVDSKAYNHIEGMHLLLLMSITDCIIGKTIYKP
jgi:D-sedoheptulose 7-phosphate isomerase